MTQYANDRRQAPSIANFAKKVNRLDAAVNRDYSGFSLQAID
jgi:hypothetical protein